jgi:hypothetical protein
MENFSLESEGKMPVERLRRRWEDNSKTYREEIIYCCVGWIHLAPDTCPWRIPVNTAMIHLFNYGLFNDAVCSPDYMT